MQGARRRPRGARKHKQVILPAQFRWADYAVSKSELNGNGPYTAEIELVAQMVPVNLIAEISFMGFEYGMSAKDVANNVVEGAQVLWRRELTLESGAKPSKPAQRIQPVGAYQCRTLRAQPSTG